MKKTIATIATVGILAVGGMALLPSIEGTLTNEEAKAQKMYLIAVDKNGEIIPDFQSNARIGDLIANAEKSGKKDVEERWVTEEEYKLAESAYIASFKPQKDAEKLAKQTELNTLKAKALSTWTESELVALEDLILQGLRFESNPQR